MAKFCSQCGRPLKEGEVCDCKKAGAASGAEQRQPEKEDAFRQSQWDQRFQNVQGNQQRSQAGYQQNGPAYQNQEQDYNRQWDNSYRREKQSSEGIISFLNTTSRSLGNALDKIYNFMTPTDRPGRTSNLVPVRKLLGFSKEDRIAQVGDCYERGMKIVPDLIQPCGQEIPVRQYDLCTTRSLLKGMWQEGRLQVTNKRVLFRLSGRNWSGRAQKSIEFTLDDVVGMEIRNGSRLSFVSMLLNLVIVAIFYYFGLFIADSSPSLELVLGLLISGSFLLLLRKHYYAKAIALAFTLPGAAYMARDGLGSIVMVLVMLLFVIHYILACIRPNFSFKIMTKSGFASPIKEDGTGTALSSMFHYFVDRGLEVLPGRDAEKAMDEVGTMIMDIQKFGDAGVQKWKENC